MKRICSSWFQFSLALILTLGTQAQAQDSYSQEEGEKKAREVLNRSIEKMGGQKYLSVGSSTSSGRYFLFRKGRQAFLRYEDWTVYKGAVKSRFKSGKKSNESIAVHNMELNKGWRLEGRVKLTEMKEPELRSFMQNVRRDLNYVLRNRLTEEGLKLYYYSKDEVGGTGESEAVEFVDVANDSVKIFFELESHLPVKVESQFRDVTGLRHVQVTEIYNWHEVDGVLTALAYDTFTDGTPSSQQFIEKIVHNEPIPPEIFLQPETKDSKKKKKKN